MMSLFFLIFWGFFLLKLWQLIRVLHVVCWLRGEMKFCRIYFEPENMTSFFII